jgi:hypothetical protein
MMGPNRYKLQRGPQVATSQKLGLLPLRSLNPGATTRVRKAQQMKRSFDREIASNIGAEQRL